MLHLACMHARPRACMQGVMSSCCPCSLQVAVYTILAGVCALKWAGSSGFAPTGEPQVCECPYIQEGRCFACGSFTRTGPCIMQAARS